LLPALSATKGSAKRTPCLNNLKQINAGIRRYYDDANDASPAAYHPQGTPIPYSWHEPRRDEGPKFNRGQGFNDAKDLVSFGDGHISYIKMYLPEVPGGWLPCQSDPPANYGYKWSGN